MKAKVCCLDSHCFSIIPSDQTLPNNILDCFPGHLKGVTAWNILDFFRIHVLLQDKQRLKQET